MIDLRYVLSGLCVGAIVGMTGVGGGSLMTPLLIMLFGVHPATAVGTDLLYAAVTKSFGTLVHGYTQTVDWRVVRRLAAGSVPATVATLLVLAQFDMRSAQAANLISRALGAALVATSLTLIFRGRLVDWFTRHLPEPAPRTTTVLTVVTGAVLGILVSVSSVGAGAIGVTALVILYPRLATARIVGSDIAHAVPLTLIAGLGHWAIGSIDTSILGSLLIGSIPGILVGSYAAIRLPDRALRMSLAVMLVIIGGRLLV
ncbi:MAG: sulfite exporter TauE/SafE family protein [Stellaceae bacterium]